jgi:hypothetical protein
MVDVHIKLSMAEQLQRDVGPGHRLRIFASGNYVFRGVLERADEEQVVVYSDLPPSDGERLCIPTENVVAFAKLCY